MFIKYVFTADADEPVQVDGVGVLENDGIFNSSGLAVYSRLMQNEQGVTFKKGNVVYVDQQSALGYQREGGRVTGFAETFKGKVEEKDRIYRRQLNDFPLMFKNLKLLSAQTLEEIRDTVQANDTTRSAYKDAESQIGVRAALIANSGEDAENLENDLAAIKASNDAKQQELEKLAKQINSLRMNIDAIYQQNRSQTIDRLRMPVSTR